MYIKPENKSDFCPCIDWHGRRYEPKGNSDGFEVMCYTKRHGTKPGAYQHKCDESRHCKYGRYVSKRVSKSWKDQSKRRHQYRPVAV